MVCRSSDPFREERDGQQWHFTAQFLGGKHRFTRLSIGDGNRQDDDTGSTPPTSFIHSLPIELDRLIERVFLASFHSLGGCAINHLGMSSAEIFISWTDWNADVEQIDAWEKSEWHFVMSHVWCKWKTSERRSLFIAVFYFSLFVVSIDLECVEEDRNVHEQNEDSDYDDRVDERIRRSTVHRLESVAWRNLSQKPSQGCVSTQKEKQRVGMRESDELLLLHAWKSHCPTENQDSTTTRRDRSFVRRENFRFTFLKKSDPDTESNVRL